MLQMTKEERFFKLFMGLSAVIYLLAGFVFVLAPGFVLTVINLLGKLTPGLPPIPMPTEKFWLALAFAMMVTIACLSYLIHYNVRKNKNYTIPLLVAKAAFSISALAFFLFSGRYLAYLAIFLVDGAIFWVTLFFYVQANRAFLKAQTAWFRQAPGTVANTGPATVVALSGEDKFNLLDLVLAQTRFFDILEDHFHKSGKSRKDFSIVIKPNFMFMHSKKDISTYTDPELVEALIDKIAAQGFANLAIVEAQSTYGNYYENREVEKVARYVGYTGKNYRIVDLTEEMVPYNYGGRLGKHFVGPTWRDADFRISFAKNKTHTFCNYTLTLKNIYGTLPMQNKLKEYHTKREYDWPTIETMKHFWVHFGLIDAFTSADGQFGVIVDPEPNHTKTIIGGKNLMAVDWVGAKKMGLDPDNPRIGRFLPLAVAAFGKPEVNWVGDQSVYSPWENVDQACIDSLDIVEEAYAFCNWWFSVLSSMDKYFTFKKKALPVIIMRKILAPVKGLLYKYDYLG